MAISIKKSFFVSEITTLVTLARNDGIIRNAKYFVAISKAKISFCVILSEAKNLEFKNSLPLSLRDGEAVVAIQ